MTELIGPFRFGVQASSAPNRSAWVELARRVEAHGYSCLTLPDHFSDQLAPGAGADGGRRRHHLAAGRRPGPRQRLQAPRRAGQGAGHHRPPLRRPARDRHRRRLDAHRLRRRRPALRPARRADRPLRRGAGRAEGPVRRRSAHVRGQALPGRATSTGCPKPVQRPRPPILVGGGGRRVLGIAAREADIVGINGTLTSGAVDPRRPGHDVRGGGRREVWRGSGRRPATASTTSS